MITRGIQPNEIKVFKQRLNLVKSQLLKGKKRLNSADKERLRIVRRAQTHLLKFEFEMNFLAKV